MAIFALVLMFGMTATASAAWIDQGSQTQVEPRIAASGAPSSVTMDIEVPGFELSTVDIDGSPHSLIAVPGHVWHMEAGLPELPYITQSIAIAGRGMPSVRVLDARWNELSVDPVVPSRGHISREVDPSTVPYRHGAFYGEGGVYPQAVTELGDAFIVRDMRGVSVRVNAFRYDADRGVLMVLRSMRLEIVTEGSGVNELAVEAGTVDPAFDRIYDHLFANYGADKYVAVGTDGPMLVVVDDALQGPLTPFVEWKQQKGIPVEVITTSSVGGSVAGIQTAIDTRYAGPDGLTYVVLVGDIAQIPTHTGTAEGNGSDATYAMVSGGDFYADLFVSRISANNSTELQTQINKFIAYERDPDFGAASDWYSKAAGLASNEGSPSDAERCNWIRDDLLAYGFTHVDQIYQPSGTTAQIAAAVNEGRSLMYYMGHGSGTSWSNPPWSNGDMPLLTNAGMHPWVIDVSCSNGTTSLNPSMAEAFLRAGSPTEPYGAVGMFSSWGTCAWVPPTVMADEAIDLFVAETTSTLGALFFYGSMAALDAYPGTGGEGHALVEQYQIFGDCSLVVRSFEPTALAPTHLPVVHLGAATFEVSGLPAGARAVLWRDGVTHGVADADGAGLATITLDTPVLTPGDVTLTITGFNLGTYQADLPAINPSVVVIDPMVIDANTPTDITVTVYGPDGITPLEGIDVWADGFGYSTVPVATGVDGVAVINVDYPFGPTLDIVGQDPAEAYLLFSQAITVNALPLTAPDLNVTTTFGMTDMYGQNMPGTMHVTVGEPGHTLYVVLPDGSELSTTDLSLEATPADLGEVVGTIAVSGYDVYSEAFDVVEAFGTLTGTVYAGGSLPMPDVTVQLLDDMGGFLMETVTDGSGVYDFGGDIAVNDYILSIDHFGFLHYELPFFLTFGPNVIDPSLDAAPAGDLSGVITETGTGTPLEGTVKVYRTDNGALVDEVVSGVDGTYTVTGLTYFTYDVNVRAYHHSPVTVAVTIDAPAVVQDFVLDPTAGDILIIDDNAKFDRDLPGKLDAKTGQLIAPPYHALPSRTAAGMVTDLEGLGYSVVLEDLGVTDPGTWFDYDMILVSMADKTAELGDTAFRAELVDFVNAGGHLLIEGGEIAYYHNDEAAFASTVLHITDWNGDSSGNVTVADPLHSVMSVPNTIVGPIACAYSGYGDADRVTVAGDGQLVGDWSNYSGLGSVVCYDPTPSPVGGQIVFFAFDYGALEVTEGLSLLHNAVNWLLAIEAPGTASVSGTVTLQGATDHSGILVELMPGGDTVTTGPSGDYAFTSLYAAGYTVTASRPSWSTDAETFTLAEGEALTGVDMVLTHVYETSACSTPALAIPDNNPTGVSDVINVSLGLGASVTAIEVFVDITHTYQGDLIVDLGSPTGTTVRLHNRSGSGADNIYGWYPTELAPAEALSGFAGVDLDGDWTLSISDNAGADIGTLNEWCMNITYGGGTTAVGDVAQRFTLGENYPNPFNPSTTIKFAVPQTGHVSLKVYDLAGRLVRTLVDADLPAVEHAVVWDGRDLTGRQVASGTYYYQLNANGLSETKQMMLIK